jgi:hypothetical protein
MLAFGVTFRYKRVKKPKALIVPTMLFLVASVDGHLRRENEDIDGN